MPATMVDEDERRARQEARWLQKEFGAEASLYAAMKAEKAIEQKDFGRCARWKRVLEILADKSSADFRGQDFRGHAAAK